MGGGHHFEYPKWVWSPAGGWWPKPQAWKRNTIMYATFVVGTSYWLYLNATPKTVSASYFWKCAFRMIQFTIVVVVYSRANSFHVFSCSQFVSCFSRRWLIIVRNLLWAVKVITIRIPPVGGFVMLTMWLFSWEGGENAGYSQVRWWWEPS